MIPVSSFLCKHDSQLIICAILEIIALTTGTHYSRTSCNYSCCLYSTTCDYAYSSHGSIKRLPTITFLYCNIFDKICVAGCQGSHSGNDLSFFIHHEAWTAGKIIILFVQCKKSENCPIYIPGAIFKDIRSCLSWNSSNSGC